MRVLVTGADGFVGRWLSEALAATGHEAVPAPPIDRLDIGDAPAVRDLVASVRPDAVVHLAAVAYAPDAAADPGEALRVNVGGTLAVVEACLAQADPPALLVAGSSEVYAAPPPGEALTETSPIAPRNPYALTKVAAEAVTVEATVRGLRGVVVRAFNHTGPGQRDSFAIPAFARRIVEARREGRHGIRVGNVDVWRDVGDVRDTVRAYVLLLEALADDRVAERPPVFNVATGRPVSIRWAIERLSEAAAWPIDLEVDPALVRASDPPWIAGDHARLTQVTGWEPDIPIERTLVDVLAAASAASGAA
jgi:GDP-4-dehydro-6-deoxy-D-mannose reductase